MTTPDIPSLPDETSPPPPTPPTYSANRGRVGVALILILAGLLLLAQQFNLLPNLNLPTAVLIFGLVGLGFFVLFLLSGLSGWGLLFPTTIPLAIAAAIWLDRREADGQLIASIIIASVALPFWVAFLSERFREWWPLIPGGILTTVAGGLYAGYALNNPEITGGIIPLGIGLSFLLVYLFDREQWWALIPAGATAFGGIFPLLAAFNLSGEYITALAFGTIGLVFVALFALRRAEWWWLIPGGSLLSIAISIMVGGSGFIGPDSFGSDRLPTAVTFLGVALTFGVIYLLRREDTQWAIYPAGILLALAAVIAFTNDFTLPLVLGALLILGGGYLLLRAWRS